MRRRRALFVACLTAGTLAGATAGVDGCATALGQSLAGISRPNLEDSLLFGAVAGQFIGLWTAWALLAVAARRGRPFHAVAGIGWGTVAAGPLTWLLIWAGVSASAAC